jgi:hypothetical protein
MSDEAVQQIQSALYAGHKIEAIKIHRGATGLGLAESKRFIEALEAELRRTDPTRFTASHAKGFGSTVLCLLLAAALFSGTAAFMRF